MGEKLRIQKWLSACGVASRRAAETLILEGRVSVNGKRVSQLGTAIDPDRDKVAVDGKRVEAQQNHVYFAIYKPRGYVSTVRDEHAEHRVVDLAPADLAGRVKPVGRLDKTSEGLMLLTDDGALIQRLTHPSYEIHKEYLITVFGAGVSREVPAKLMEGLELDDGLAVALDAKIIRSEGDEATLQITLGEGRKRQIRRMFEALGLKVRFLKRVRLGPIRLSRMRRGECRRLTPQEVRSLYEATGLVRKPVQKGRGNV